MMGQFRILFGFIMPEMPGDGSGDLGAY